MTTLLVLDDYQAAFLDAALATWESDISMDTGQAVSQARVHLFNIRRQMERKYTAAEITAIIEEALVLAPD